MMPSLQAPGDTIAAAATPPGRGGVAVIRVSGPLVTSIMQALLKCQLTPRKATLLPFYNADEEILDKGIALFFPNPHSFTGEDVLELHGHGGPFVVDLLIKAIIASGARLAQPGEFSLRAFLNDKIDLTQAEAIADLIDASSHIAARSAMRSLQGEFSQVISAISEQLITTRLHIEALIDFSDENIDFASQTKIATFLDKIMADVQMIFAKARQGSLLRDGVNVVIAGKPNVGKSSLLNCLSGKSLAIVTDIPGTTRDVLRDDIILDGIPLHMMDTAGIRQSDDVVENEGIKRALQAAENADIVLYVFDESNIQALREEHLSFVDDSRYLFVRNKIDVHPHVPELAFIKQPIINISAKTGAGISDLTQAIKQKVGFTEHDNESVFIARRRHLEALTLTKAYVNASSQQLENGSLDLAAEELRLAQCALNEITGEFTADDLLGRIFSTFCIGK